MEIVASDARDSLVLATSSLASWASRSLRRERGMRSRGD